MRLSALQAAIGSASVFFAHHADASIAHRHAHNDFGRRHMHGLAGDELVVDQKIEKRGTCSLPTDSSDLYHVPGASNNGFAMSPDQPCTEGSYCPIACAPGKVMAQWQPNTTYVYPESMNGGLLCKDGTPVKPFPNSPYCVDGTGTVNAVNDCGKPVSFCQTVLPGNEAMLIPTLVSSSAALAVPGHDYWDGTAAHYYINPPGVGITEGCVWGESDKPWGNWAPYVAGANTDASGLTYVKIAYNPIWTGCNLGSSAPSFGVKIECPNGGCNGLPCSINPATDGIGVVNSPDSTVGVGGASFCVVTVPKGGSANIVVFNTDGSTGSASSSAPHPSAAASSSKAPSTSSAAPTTSSSSSSSTSSHTSATSSTTSSPSSKTSTFSSRPSSSSSASTSTSLIGGIFHENSTRTSTSLSSKSTITSAATLDTTSSATATTEAPVPTTSESAGAADEGGAAIAGLIVAFVAAAALI